MSVDGIRRAAVVGTTAWGTTLAIVLARNGVAVTLLTRTAGEAARLQADRCNSRHLPEIPFPDALQVSADPTTLEDAELICFVVPAQTLAWNAAAVASHVPLAATLLSGAKGIEAETGRRMTEVLAEALPGRPMAALSGPNLSREVAAGLPGTTLVASTNAPIEAISGAFHSPAFRVYTSEDIVGVEFAGALKNIIAIAAGMVDAFGSGDNAKAAIITRGLSEMSRLGVAAGADPLTFQGLAGIGDLIATSYSLLSRNRRLGELLGSGKTLEQALEEIGETVEGATTMPAALRLAARLGVEMPIVSGLQGILYEQISPEDAVTALLGRNPRPEIVRAPSHRDRA